MRERLHTVVVLAGKGARLVALRAASLSREGETPEQVKERRMRESQRVEERVHVIFNYEEFQHELEQACAQATVHRSPTCLTTEVSWHV